MEQGLDACRRHCHRVAQSDVTEAIIEEFGAELSLEALSTAKAAATIMTMNNVHYRFAHLINGNYPNITKLRINVMAKLGVDKASFELWSLAVSPIDGCCMCMESHDGLPDSMD